MRNIDIVLHEATFYEFYDFLRGGHAHVGVTAFIDEERERELARYRGMGFAGDALLEDEYRVFLSPNILCGKDELTSEDAADWSSLPIPTSTTGPIPYSVRPRRQMAGDGMSLSEQPGEHHAGHCAEPCRRTFSAQDDPEQLVCP